MHLPPYARYSPILNPIEHGFGNLKKRIKRARGSGALGGPAAAVACRQLMAAIPRKSWWGYFHDAGVCPPWQGASTGATTTTALLLLLLRLLRPRG